MKKETYAKNAKRSGGILYWAVGSLLVFTLVTAWLVCGLFAKYTTSGADGDSARVAATGVIDFRVLEHKAVNVSEKDATKVYELDMTTVVSKNTYNTIPPGYDIPKDPFVRLKLVDSEVDYRLYLKMIKSEDFPNTVTVLLDESWVYDKVNDIYEYHGTFSDEKNDVLVSDGYFDAGSFEGDIYILKNNLIYISQNYKGEPFTVTFEAYLKQVD